MAGSLIVIRDQTTVSDADLFERALEQSSPLPASIVNSYRSRNAASYRLSPNLDLEQNYTVIREEDAQEVLRRGGAKWAEFRTSYAGARGMVSFSRIGFSAAEDTALAVMGFVCGDLCAVGGLYLVAKEGGSWIVQEALMTWMA